MAEIFGGNENIAGAQSNSETPSNGLGGLIIESNTEKFGEDVINASSHLPVIVDFWAPWCEPCKKMTPILEKLVLEYDGQVKLVKINIDENQSLAQQLRVQSIPMVYAFKDGQPADAFSGALPESQLRQFIEKLTDGDGSPIDQAIVQAKDLLETGDADNASSIFSQILASDSQNAEAHVGLIKCFMVAGKIEQAQNYLANLSEELLKNNAIAAIRTALELEEQKADAGEVDELKKLILENPDNHQARFDCALALYAAGEIGLAVDELVEIIKRNREWNDDAARQQLFKIFDALGHADPITVDGRRKMSSVLFS